MDQERTSLIPYLKDLKVLIEQSQWDYVQKVHSSYNDYLAEYNDILMKLRDLGHFCELDIIIEVPSGQRASGRGAPAEVAKHQEVITKAKKLSHRLEDEVGIYQTENDTKLILKNLFEKFHNVARQLRGRYNNRPTLDINDEYDVQDLLHALLKIYFDDVRPEEWTPSYAGGSKRMDFLLKNEKIVIEVKKTRKNLTDKEVGEQLIIDIASYNNHPDCEYLICFVYDPEGKIVNPKGLENDLSKTSSEGLHVDVYIYPK
ncbi:hypothetical protein [Brevibacillus sp. MER 51]|uniref:PD-(D/E)XK nuclease domain-containing protein n=1 Tax=Brevibacillus sp. MER 51 TaxID=2939560 RepID=UPI00203FF059|nr:hypothetical protein [Brevibacillus sp. MER 51]MCM3144692.1 hypothetical protein [Brevibacillus sp. MER 51]